MAEVVDEVTLAGGLLVGHDGSAAAGEGVRWAARLAADLGEPLHVLRAWALLNAPEPPSKVGGFIPPLEDWEAAVHADLAADVDRLELGDVEVHLHVAHRQSSAALLHAGQGARMLVVARRGSGGFSGLGFGSTADQVVRHAPCPVVVVPLPDE